MNLKDLLPSDDLDELFTLMDSKDHWLLLIVDFLPVAAIISALSRLMLHPPKSFRVSGLPPVIALPKKDVSTKVLASIMSTAAGGPIPEETIQRMIGDRSVILCAEPKSLELGLEAMERFMVLHREWKTERYGIQLFFITNRLYKEDYESAIDFLAWLLAGVVSYTTFNEKKTDVEIVTSLAEQIWTGATGGGKEKADRTAKALKESSPHMEESLKILDGVARDLENKDRAICILHQWMRANVLPSECAEWAASNMGLLLALLGGDFNGHIAEISEKILVRIRDRTFATNLWVRQRSSVPLEKLGRPLDERQKIEPDKD